MADRLEIYKGALRLIGHSAGLSSLTEPSPARRALDDAWRSSVEFVLAKGLWNHAMRPVELTADANIEPRFGYMYSFSKPDDWIQTAGISANTRGDAYNDVQDEGAFWHANANPLYIRYVSNDDAYGWDVGRWRQPFAKCVEAYLAYECGLAISADKGNRNDMFSLFGKALKEAKTLDAFNERVLPRNMGTLAQARMSSRSSRMYD